MSDIYICNWEDCVFEGYKKDAIRHVIMQHAPLNEVPFHCNLCSYRATNMKALNRHANTFKKHIELSNTLEGSDEQYFINSYNPYNVTWGNKSKDISMKSFLEEIVEEIVIEEIVEEEMVEETVVSSSCQTEDTYATVRDLKEEMFVLKGSHQVQMNQMADYIVRLERRLNAAEKENNCLKQELKIQDPFIQGFEEMWDDTKRHSNKRLNKENICETPVKKIKSVVKKLF